MQFNLLEATSKHDQESYSGMQKFFLSMKIVSCFLREKSSAGMWKDTHACFYKEFDFASSILAFTHALV